ncbi:MAG: hypothetical protein CMH57_03070 [Myxococcales bacterium]|nr:hypothetical protein [Myxococcales bacterium]
MDEPDAYDVLLELVERTEEFISALPASPEDHVNPLDPEALLNFVRARQALLDQIEDQPISDPDAVELGQHLLDLDAQLNARLRGERDQIQVELTRLRKGRRGLQGYRHRPSRGRKTLSVEG